jgi:hypothetical protein
VLLDLRDQRPGLFAVLTRNLDTNGVVDLGEVPGKDGVDDDALDLHDAAGLLSVFVGHESPVTRSIAARLVRRRHKLIGVLRELDRDAVAHRARGRAPLSSKFDRRVGAANGLEVRAAIRECLGRAE